MFDSNMEWAIGSGEKSSCAKTFGLIIVNSKLDSQGCLITLSSYNPLCHFGKLNKDNWVWEFDWRREWFEWEKTQSR